MGNEILDIHKRAISTALIGQREAISGLSSAQDGIRRQAYDIISGSVNDIEWMSEVPPTTIPEFFLEGGELLTALGYVREQLRIGVKIDPGFLLTLVQKGCREYIVAKSGNGSTPESQVEDSELAGYCDTVSMLVRGIISEVPRHTSEYHMLSAYISHNIDGDAESTKVFLKEAIRLDPKNPENYIRLAALSMNENDVTKSYRILRVGFRITRDEKLFELIIELSSQYFYDGWAKAFYRRYQPETYIHPFSFARGIYKYGDPQNDLRFSILVGLETKNFSGKFSSYTKSALDVLDLQIEVALEGLNFQEGLDYADAHEKDQDELFALLELFETEIFYLLDFRDLNIYLQILSRLTQTKKGQTLLGEYFERYKLDGIMHEPENTLDLSVANPEDGTPILQADVSGGGTLGESLTARLTFIMVHLHHHAFKVNEFTPTQSSPEGEEGKENGTPRDDVTGDQGATGESYSGYREEFGYIGSICHGYMGSVMRGAWEHFDQKRRDEELSIEQLGPRTSQQYYEIIDGIDEKYGLTVRGYLAHFARRDTFQGSAVPPICHEASACMYFFIAERLITGDHELFQGKLPQILKSLDKGDIGMVITLAEILFANTYYEEAIELVCECPGALDDIEGQMIVIKALVKYTGDDGLTERLHQYVDDSVSGQSDFDSLYDLLSARYEELHPEVQEKILLSHLSDDGDIVVSEEDADQIEILGMLEYMVGALLDDPDGRSQFFQEAKGHRSSEACLLQALDDMEAGRDKENIFEGLVEHFPETQYPIRKEFFYWIVNLALDTKQFQRAMEYIHVAHVEGVDLFEYMPSDFWKSQEKRSVFYTMYIREGFQMKLGKDIPGVLLQGIQKDMQHMSLPFLTRISAAFVQTQLLSDENGEYIPGYVRYWDYFVDQILHQSDDPKIFDDCIDLVSDMYKDFDIDEIPKTKLIGVTAIHFLASKVYAYIASTIRQKIQSRAPKEVIRELMQLLESFLEKTLYLIARIPDFHSISSSEMIEDPSKDNYDSTDIVYRVPKKEIPQILFVPDFWHQKHLLLHRQMRDLEGITSSDNFDLPYTAIGGKPHIFPPHITLQ